MSEKTALEKSASMQTKILALQAYQNHQLSGKLDRVSSAIEDSVRVQEEIASLQREQADEARKQTIQLEIQTRLQELDRSEKEKEKHLRQALFDASEALDALKNEKDFLLKLAKLADIRQQMATHEITPSLVESLDEKKFISEFLKRLAKEYKEATESEVDTERMAASALEEMGVIGRVKVRKVPASEAEILEIKDQALEWIDKLGKSKSLVKESTDLDEFLRRHWGKGVTEYDLPVPGSVLADLAWAIGFGALAFWCLTNMGYEDASWWNWIGIIGGGLLCFAFLAVMKQDSDAKKAWFLQPFDKSIKAVKLVTPLQTLVSELEEALLSLGKLKEEVAEANERIKSLKGKLATLAETYDSFDLLFPRELEDINVTDYIVISEE